MYIWGDVCLCGEGKGFFMHGKRLLYPSNYWAAVPDACAVGGLVLGTGVALGFGVCGGKTTPHYPIRPHVFQK